MTSIQYSSTYTKHSSTHSHRRFHRAYDGLGRRAFRAAYSGATITDRTFYGYYKNFLIEEKTESFTSTGVLDGSSITKNYIYGPNGEDDIALIIQKYVKKIGTTTTTTTTNYYYHKDHLSSPEKISNDSGAIIEEYAYTPYGATFIKNSSTTGAYIPVSVYTSTILPKISLGNTGSLYGNNRLYTGREYDKESGLYYNRARYYDPTHGRFMSRDPIGYIDDVNPYRYVGNNPMMYSDPSGMFAKKMLSTMIDRTFDLLIMYGEGIDKTGKQLAPAAITLGCAGLAGAALSTGYGVVVSGQACALGGTIGGIAASSTSLIGITMKAVGQGGKEIKEKMQSAGKQDKVARPQSLLEEIAEKNGYNKFHELKDSFKLPDPKKWDAYFTKDGELYFGRKNIKGEGNYEPVFTNFFK